MEDLAKPAARKNLMTIVFAGATAGWSVATMTRRWVAAALLRDGNGMAPRRQGVAEALARADPELREHLSQMPLDGMDADEEFGADFLVRPAGQGESRNVLLLRCELIAGVVVALADRRAGREQFVSRALGETVRADRAEHVICG